MWLTSRALSTDLLDRYAGGGTLSLHPSGALRVSGVLPLGFVVPVVSEGEGVHALVELGAARLAVSEGPVTTSLTLVARLREGIGAAQAEAALNAQAVPRRFAVRVRPLAAVMKARQQPLALGAMLGGLLVLATAAINTLGLALTRGLYRAPETATMEILGAGRLRIVRLLLIESLCVAAVATAGALLIAVFLIDGVLALLPRALLTLGPPEISGRTIVFATLSGLAAALAWWLGSVIAWLRGLRVDLRGAVAADGRTVRAVRLAATAGQVALAIALFAGAGLLIRSYLNLVHQETGLSAESLTVSVDYGPHRSGVALTEITARTVEGLRRLPGARAAAAVVGEMVDQYSVTGMVLFGRPAPVEVLWVSEDYFEATGMSFLTGRPLVEQDAAGRGVVVNETLVTRYLNGTAAVGDTLNVGGRLSPIVGIVKDSRRQGLDRSPRPAVFRALDGTAPGQRVTYVMSGNASAGLAESLVYRLSADAVVLDGSTVRERLARTIRMRSFATLVVGLFAAAAIVITVTGVVTVVGYAVARRTREIGIRLAIGATSGDVIWLTMREVCQAIGVGVVIGVAGYLWWSSLLSSLLYGISPTDGITLTILACTLTALALLAALLPARHAATLSPTAALRED